MPQQIGYLVCGRENHAEVGKKRTDIVVLGHGILASMLMLDIIPMFNYEVIAKQLNLKWTISSENRPALTYSDILQQKRIIYLSQQY